MSQPVFDRRNALKVFGAAVVAAGGPWAAGGQEQPTSAPAANRKRVLRAAHITDVHIDGHKGSEAGLARCLEHIQRQPEAPTMILNTGDTVMCVNGVDESEARRQWAVWNRVVREANKLPMHSAIGNHDSWGWKPPTADAPMLGKGLALDVLGLRERFYRVDQGGWTFLFLDSVYGSYHGQLDEPQLEWLRGQLDEIAGKRHVCVLTHIPIVTACGFFDGERFKNGDWSIPGSWMHIDALALKKLFGQHGNVRAALSGHMHQIDRIDFNGVSYICGGAVSASWWGGKYYDCDYGYGLADFYDDGSVEYRYVTFGWGT